MAIDRNYKYQFVTTLANGWRKRMTIYSYGDQTPLLTVNESPVRSINKDIYELFDRDEPTIGFMNVASWMLEFDTSVLNSNLYAMLYDASDFYYEDWTPSGLINPSIYPIKLKIERSNILIVEFNYGDGWVQEWIGFQESISNFEFDASNPYLQVNFVDFNTAILNNIDTYLVSQLWKFDDSNLNWFSSTFLESEYNAGSGWEANRDNVNIAMYFESAFLLKGDNVNPEVPTNVVAIATEEYEYIFIRQDSINAYIAKIQDKIREILIREPLQHGNTGYHEFKYPYASFKLTWNNNGAIGSVVNTPYVLGYITYNYGWYKNFFKYRGLQETAIMFNYDDRCLVGGLLYENKKYSYGNGLSKYEDKNLYQILKENYEQYFRKSYVSPVGGFVNTTFYNFLDDAIDITDYIMQYSDNIKVTDSDIISESFFDLVDAEDDDIDTVGSINPITYRSTIAENEFTLQSVFHSNPTTATFLSNNESEGETRNHYTKVKQKIFVQTGVGSSTFVQSGQWNAIKHRGEHLFGLFYIETASTSIPVQARIGNQFAVRCHEWANIDLGDGKFTNTIAYAENPTVPINQMQLINDYNFDTGYDEELGTGYTQDLINNANPKKKQSINGCLNVGANTMAALFGSRQNLTVDIEGCELSDEFIKTITFTDLEDEISGQYDKKTNMLMFPMYPFKLDMRKILNNPNFAEQFMYFQIKSVNIDWSNQESKTDFTLIGINNKITTVI